MQARTVARIKANMAKAEAEVKGEALVWRTIDPGGQHPIYTGSFQPGEKCKWNDVLLTNLREPLPPVFAPASEFYPASHYRPFHVGLSPAIAVVIVQLRKQHHGWRSLPGDLAAEAHVG
jgi:hypothetical protein